MFRDEGIIRNQGLLAEFRKVILGTARLTGKGNRSCYPYCGMY